tara:strand:+ start:4866 stop:16796 length:11931 start_codon:yes stop_codon:yes gene_type:complete
VSDRQDYESFVKQLGEAGDNPAIWEELHDTIKGERQETEAPPLPPEVLGTDTGDVEERFLQPPSKAPWLQNQAPTPAPTHTNEDLNTPSGRYVSATVPQTNPSIPSIPEAGRAIGEATELARIFNVSDYSREAINNVMDFTATSDFDAGDRVLGYINVEQTQDIRHFEILKQLADRSGRDILNSAVSDVYIGLDVTDQNVIWGSIVSEYDKLGDQQTLYQIRKSSGDKERMAYAVAATVDFALSQPSRVSPNLLDTLKKYGLIQNKLPRPKEQEQITRKNPFVITGNLISSANESFGGLVGAGFSRLWEGIQRVERDDTGYVLDNSWANFYRYTGDHKNLSEYLFFNAAEINQHHNVFATLRDRGKIAATDLAARRNDLMRSMESYGTGGQQYFAVTLPILELVQIKSLPVFRDLSYEQFLEALMLTEGDLAPTFTNNQSKLERLTLGASGPNYSSSSPTMWNSPEGNRLKAEGLWTHIGLSTRQQEVLHNILVHGFTAPRVMLLGELEAENERREKAQKILLDWRDARIAMIKEKGGKWPQIDPTFEVPASINGHKVDLDPISNTWLISNGFKQKPQKRSKIETAANMVGVAAAVSARSAIAFDETIADDLSRTWLINPGYAPEEHFEGVMDDEYKREMRKKFGMLASALRFISVDMTAEDYDAKADEARRTDNQALEDVWLFMKRITEVDQKVSSAANLYMFNWPAMALETGERLWNFATKAHAMSTGYATGVEHTPSSFTTDWNMYRHIWDQTVIDDVMSSTLEDRIPDFLIEDLEEVYGKDVKQVSWGDFTAFRDTKIRSDSKPNGRIRTELMQVYLGEFVRADGQMNSEGTVNGITSEERLEMEDAFTGLSYLGFDENGMLYLENAQLFLDYIKAGYPASHALQGSVNFFERIHVGSTLGLFGWVDLLPVAALSKGILAAKSGPRVAKIAGGASELDIISHVVKQGSLDLSTNNRKEVSLVLETIHKVLDVNAGEAPKTIRVINADPKVLAKEGSRLIPTNLGPIPIKIPRVFKSRVWGGADSLDELRKTPKQLPVELSPLQKLVPRVPKKDELTILSSNPFGRFWQGFTGQATVAGTALPASEAARRSTSRNFKRLLTQIRKAINSGASSTDLSSFRNLDFEHALDGAATYIDNRYSLKALFRTNKVARTSKRPASLDDTIRAENNVAGPHRLSRYPVTDDAGRPIVYSGFKGLGLRIPTASDFSPLTFGRQSKETAYVFHPYRFTMDLLFGKGGGLGARAAFAATSARTSLNEIMFLARKPLLNAGTSTTEQTFVALNRFITNLQKAASSNSSVEMLTFVRTHGFNTLYDDTSVMFSLMADLDPKKLVTLSDDAKSKVVSGELSWEEWVRLWQGELESWLNESAEIAYELVRPGPWHNSVRAAYKLVNMFNTTLSKFFLSRPGFAIRNLETNISSVVFDGMAFNDAFFTNPDRQWRAIMGVSELATQGYARVGPQTLDSSAIINAPIRGGKRKILGQIASAAIGRQSPKGGWKRAAWDSVRGGNIAPFMSMPGILPQAASAAIEQQNKFQMTSLLTPRFYRRFIQGMSDNLSDVLSPEQNKLLDNHPELKQDLFEHLENPNTASLDSSVELILNSETDEVIVNFQPSTKKLIEEYGKNLSIRVNETGLQQWLTNFIQERQAHGILDSAGRFDGSAPRNFHTALLKSLDNAILDKWDEISMFGEIQKLKITDEFAKATANDVIRFMDEGYEGPEVLGKLYSMYHRLTLKLRTRLIESADPTIGPKQYEPAELERFVDNLVQEIVLEISMPLKYIDGLINDLDEVVKDPKLFENRKYFYIKNLEDTLGRYDDEGQLYLENMFPILSDPQRPNEDILNEIDNSSELLGYQMIQRLIDDAQYDTGPLSTYYGYTKTVPRSKEEISEAATVVKESLTRLREASQLASPSIQFPTVDDAHRVIRDNLYVRLQGLDAENMSPMIKRSILKQTIIDIIRSDPKPFNDQVILKVLNSDQQALFSKGDVDRVLNDLIQQNYFVHHRKTANLKRTEEEILSSRVKSLENKPLSMQESGNHYTYDINGLVRGMPEDYEMNIVSKFGGNSVDWPDTLNYTPPTAEIRSRLIEDYQKRPFGSIFNISRDDKGEVFSLKDMWDVGANFEGIKRFGSINPDSFSGNLGLQYSPQMSQKAKEAYFNDVVNEAISEGQITWGQSFLGDWFPTKKMIADWKRALKAQAKAIDAFDAELQKQHGTSYIELLKSGSVHPDDLEARAAFATGNENVIKFNTGYGQAIPLEEGYIPFTYDGLHMTGTPMYTREEISTFLGTGYTTELAGNALDPAVKLTPSTPMAVRSDLEDLMASPLTEEELVNILRGLETNLKLLAEEASFKFINDPQLNSGADSFGKASRLAIQDKLNKIDNLIDQFIQDEGQLRILTAPTTDGNSFQSPELSQKVLSLMREINTTLHGTGPVTGEKELKEGLVDDILQGYNELVDKYGLEPVESIKKFEGVSEATIAGKVDPAENPSRFESHILRTGPELSALVELFKYVRAEAGVGASEITATTRRADDPIEGLAPLDAGFGQIPQEGDPTFGALTTTQEYFDRTSLTRQLAEAFQQDARQYQQEYFSRAIDTETDMSEIERLREKYGFDLGFYDRLVRPEYNPESNIFAKRITGVNGTYDSERDIKNAVGYVENGNSNFNRMEEKLSLDVLENVAENPNNRTVSLPKQRDVGEQPGQTASLNVRSQIFSPAYDWSKGAAVWILRDPKDRKKDVVFNPATSPAVLPATVGLPTIKRLDGGTSSYVYPNGVNGRVFSQRPPEGYIAVMTDDSWNRSVNGEYEGMNRLAIFIREDATMAEIEEGVTILKAHQDRMAEFKDDVFKQTKQTSRRDYNHSGYRTSISAVATPVKGKGAGVSQKRYEEIYDVVMSEYDDLGDTNSELSARVTAKIKEAWLFSRKNSGKSTDEELLGIVVPTETALRRRALLDIAAYILYQYDSGFPPLGKNLKTAKEAQKYLEDSMLPAFIARQREHSNRRNALRRAGEFKDDGTFEVFPTTSHILNKEETKQYATIQNRMQAESNEALRFSAKLAEAQSNWLFHDYSNLSNLDTVLRVLGPWHIWQTRTLAKMAINFAEEPRLLARLTDFFEVMRDLNREYGPEWLSTDLPIGALLKFMMSPWYTSAKLIQESLGEKPHGWVAAIDKLEGSTMDLGGFIFYGDVLPDPWIGSTPVPGGVSPSDIQKEKGYSGPLGYAADTYKRVAPISPALDLILDATGARGPLAKMDRGEKFIDDIQRGASKVLLPTIGLIPFGDKVASVGSWVRTDSKKREIDMQYFQTLAMLYFNGEEGSEYYNEVVHSWQSWSLIKHEPTFNIPVLHFLNGPFGKELEGKDGEILSQMIRSVGTNKYIDNASSYFVGNKVRLENTVFETEDGPKTVYDILDELRYVHQTKGDYDTFFEKYPFLKHLLNNRKETTSAIIIAQTKSRFYGGLKDLRDIRQSVYDTVRPSGINTRPEDIRIGMDSNEEVAHVISQADIAYYTGVHELAMGIYNDYGINVGLDENTYGPIHNTFTPRPHSLDRDLVRQTYAQNLIEDLRFKVMFPNDTHLWGYKVADLLVESFQETGKFQNFEKAEVEEIIADILEEWNKTNGYWDYTSEQPTEGALNLKNVSVEMFNNFVINNEMEDIYVTRNQVAPHPYTELGWRTYGLVDPGMRLGYRQNDSTPYYEPNLAAPNKTRTNLIDWEQYIFDVEDFEARVQEEFGDDGLQLYLNHQAENDSLEYVVDRAIIDLATSDRALSMIYYEKYADDPEAMDSWIAGRVKNYKAPTPQNVRDWFWSNDYGQLWMQLNEVSEQDILDRAKDRLDLTDVKNISLTDILTGSWDRKVYMLDADFKASGIIEVEDGVTSTSLEELEPRRARHFQTPNREWIISTPAMLEEFKLAMTIFYARRDGLLKKKLDPEISAHAAYIKYFLPDSSTTIARHIITNTFKVHGAFNEAEALEQMFKAEGKNKKELYKGVS